MVSMHPGNVAEELNEFVANNGASIIFDDRVQRSGDLSMLVSQMAAMDVIVSVDDFVLALASAMGLRAIKLAGAGEHWSWGLQSGQSKWWPGVEIIRSQAGDLANSIEPILELITTRLASRP